MPVYQVSYQHGRLTEDPKAKAAAAITDAHVETTGAPRIYGLILPRPGDEPQWFADNAVALDGISGTGL